MAKRTTSRGESNRRPEVVFGFSDDFPDFRATHGSQLEDFVVGRQPNPRRGSSSVATPRLVRRLHLRERPPPYLQNHEQHRHHEYDAQRNLHLPPHSVGSALSHSTGA